MLIYVYIHTFSFGGGSSDVRRVGICEYPLELFESANYWQTNNCRCYFSFWQSHACKLKTGKEEKKGW